MVRIVILKQRVMMIACMFEHQPTSTTSGISSILLQFDRVEDKVGPNDLDVPPKQATLADGHLGALRVQVLYVCIVTNHMISKNCHICYISDFFFFFGGQQSVVGRTGGKEKREEVCNVYYGSYLEDGLVEVVGVTQLVGNVIGH